MSPSHPQSLMMSLHSISPLSFPISPLPLSPLSPYLLSPLFPLPLSLLSPYPLSPHLPSPPPSPFLLPPLSSSPPLPLSPYLPSPLIPSPYLSSYFDALDRIRAEGYIPSVDDVLRVRVPTTGIVEYNFQMRKEVVFK